MSKRPPQDPTPIPDKPFESENVWAEEGRRVYREQKRESGNLPDQPVGNPVRDSKPFKKLKSP